MKVTWKAVIIIEKIEKISKFMRKKISAKKWHIKMSIKNSKMKRTKVFLYYWGEGVRNYWWGSRPYNSTPMIYHDIYHMTAISHRVISFTDSQTFNVLLCNTKIYYLIKFKKIQYLVHVIFFIWIFAFRHSLRKKETGIAGSFFAVHGSWKAFLKESFHFGDFLELFRLLQIIFLGICNTCYLYRLWKNKPNNLFLITNKNKK